MDRLTRLGGRKFLMALLVIGIAVFLEVSGRGLTPTMAGFLVGIAGMFSVANTASSAAFMKSKPASADTADKLEAMHETIKENFAPQKTDDLRQLLVSINTGVTQATNLSGQTAQAMLNLSQVLNNIKRN